MTHPLWRTRALCLVSTASLALLAPAGAAAQTSGTRGQVDEIVVTGSRLPRDLSSVPGSVSVIDLATLNRQREITNDLPQILAQTVPGFGVNSFGSASNFDQTLRGRKPAVLIDGVPTTVPLSDGGRDMRAIGPSAVGRIEVIRGSTAIYGFGGAGGLINYVTRQPGEGAPEFYTQVGGGLSLTHPGDSFKYNLEQSLSGKSGRLSYLATGSYEQYASLFDGDGDRIAPDPNRQGGIADNRIYNLFSKLGYELTDTQSVQVSVNKYRGEQDTDWHAGNGVFGVTKTPVLPGKDPREQNQYIDNFLTTGRYTNADLLGSSINLLGYYSEYGSRFSFFPAPTFPPNGGQSTLTSKKRGARLDVATPIQVLSGARLLWGGDATADKTMQRLGDGRAYVPPMELTSYAAFAQLEVDATSWLKLRGGVRYEDVTLDVPTFTTIASSAAFAGGNVVQGGSIGYSKAVYNIGAVVDFTENLSGFAAFSQGFSVAELGRILRTTVAPSISAFRAKAQVINNYETGVRANFGPVKATVATFVSTSGLGATYNAVTLEVTRAKEKTWGVEATLDWNISETLRAGGTWSRVDGKRDSNGDGTLDLHLDTTRINPSKLTAYIEYEPLPKWQTRLQMLHSGSQNRFPNDLAPAFGRARVASFTLFDASLSLPLGPGTFGIGVQNLLNEKYFTPSTYRNPVASQYVMGVGATATATYSLKY